MLDGEIDKDKRDRSATGPCNRVIAQECEDDAGEQAGHKHDQFEGLHALEEGVSTQELRAINAALDEELNDPSPGLTLEQARKNLRALKPDDLA